jgi:hypothetical protein
VRLPDGNDPLMSLHDFLQTKTKLTAPSAAGRSVIPTPLRTLY